MSDRTIPGSLGRRLFLWHVDLMDPNTGEGVTRPARIYWSPEQEATKERVMDAVAAEASQLAGGKIKFRSISCHLETA